MIRFFLFILWLAAGATSVQADELRPGYIEIAQISEMDWRLVWKAPMKAGITPDTQPILPDNCTTSGAPSRERLEQAVVTRLRLRCEGSIAGKKIGLANFGGTVTDVLLRYIPEDGGVLALRLTASQPIVQIPEKAKSHQVVWTYFVIGIEHIIFGLDHLLFVFCLVLLINGGWMVIKTVTAFTIAHSITLVGTTLGWFYLPQQPVEAVIALSIIFLATEILKKRENAPRLSERIPWIVAFLFGLLHGFGFAGALSEIGLPEGEVPTALLTFNIGVEVGQVAIVLITITALRLLRMVKQEALVPTIRIASYVIGILASFWFIERLIA